ncbi:hypothetical protein BASA81_002590 [Batrachochytrium salamandrivorans]|nr:hypothetical protein BASA81_002590 [Batrachochytrium salamandrivorans]
MGIRPRLLSAAAVFAIVGGGIMVEDRRRRMVDYFEHQQQVQRLRSFSPPSPPSPPSSPPLKVVVIGGGIAGLSVAYYLKLLRPTTSVLVVEAESLACLASSHNAGTIGLVQEFDLADGGKFKPEWHDVLELLSTQTYRSLEDCELIESGALMVAETAREVDYLVAKHQHLVSKGFTQAQLLSSPQQVRKIEPALSSGVLAAVHYPGSVHVDPRKASLAVAEAAAKLGVEFLEGDGAVKLVEGRDWTVALSSGKALVCDVVVVANGLGCNKLLSETLVVPVKGQICQYDNNAVTLNKILFSASAHAAFADRLVESTPPQCTMDTSIRHLYGRQTATGDLILGGSRIPTNKLDYRPDVGVTRAIASHAQQLLPALSLTTLPNATWACFMPFSVDGKPFVGRSEYSPRLFLSLGFGPEGMTHAPGAGLVLAQQIYGLSPASPSFLPEHAAMLLVLRELDPNRKRRKIRPVV